MDIYVPKRHYKRLVKELSTLLNVAFQNTSIPEDGYMEGGGIKKMVTLTVQNRRYQKPNLCFQIIQSIDQAADTPLAYFHSTIVMNFLAHDHIAVAYPKLTLNRAGILNNTITNFHAFHIPAIAKYISRGYQLRYSTKDILPDTTVEKEYHNFMREEPWCVGTYTCPKEWRLFYDEKSLILPVGNHSKILSAPWVTIWRFGGFGCGAGCYVHEKTFAECVRFDGEFREQSFLHVSS